MHYRITGLDPAPFSRFYGLSDDELKTHNIVRYRADERPGFPDRIEMRDLEIGESALLLNHMHQPADSPYRSAHAIFVREGADNAYDRVDEIPEVMHFRPISLRGFDKSGFIVDAGLANGKDAVEAEILRLLAQSDVAYIHAHNAARGCYSGLIRRA